MRSRELADLAGVTVRTVRHYHQIGLLREPPRTMNGYRRYTVDDLVRLLRIRHLVEAGVSLSEVEEALDEESSVVGVLDRVEADIDARMARLRTQRELVRSLRAQWQEPEAADGVVGALAAVHRESGLPAEAARLDSDTATLVVHLSGGDTSAVEEGLAAIGGLKDAPSFFAAINGLVDLAPDAGEAARNSVADALRPHLSALADVRPPKGRLARLLGELRTLRLNPAQLDALDRLGQY
ncbi:MerR family transcriptional regulator [Nocardiopsis sp. B62]|uniref:MerR family transcriptional regulator n=1 Tax=Nocardiopsis sp. B62 TaxID=2824874 RepID=UPI001B366B90|nr:MerR family transcriptional regulator [Nocardiopsis sp. B62]MBQ1080535.1 MerR family transcriptional regulator [Nocardiopsis sp. B62]